MTTATATHLTAAATLCRTAADTAEHVGAVLDRLGVHALTVHVTIRPHASYASPALVSVQVRAVADLEAAGGALALGPANTYEVGVADDRYNLVKRAGSVGDVAVELFCREAPLP